MDSRTHMRMIEAVLEEFDVNGLGPKLYKFPATEQSLFAVYDNDNDSFLKVSACFLYMQGTEPLPPDFRFPTEDGELLQHKDWKFCAVHIGILTVPGDVRTKLQAATKKLLEVK